MSKLSIVIPVFNKWNFTKSCLNDLSFLPTDTHEIIVVDNGSIDETKLNINKFPFVKYVRNDENRGFAAACNIGFSLTSNNNIMFLNNDIRVKANHKDWTRDIITLSRDALVGPTMGQLDDKLNFVRESNKELTGNSYMSGWCLTSSKDIWKKLDISNNQIFSEDFFCYFEDTDLSFRARKIGIPMKLVDIPVVHFGKISSNQINTHKLYSEARKIFLSKWVKP